MDHGKLFPIELFFDDNQKIRIRRRLFDELMHASPIVHSDHGTRYSLSLSLGRDRTDDEDRFIHFSRFLQSSNICYDDYFHARHLTRSLMIAFLSIHSNLSKSLSLLVRQILKT
jgi:hypothetical protein